MLLVEPCDMVRQVNLLSLRTWGTSVCAVKTEDEAISRLKLRSKSSHHHACRYRVDGHRPRPWAQPKYVWCTQASGAKLLRTWRSMHVVRR